MIARLRERIELLESERYMFAKLALPKHKLGGFDSPIIAARVQVRALAVLERREL